MGKLTTVAGFAAGYVLGARAGRERYDQITEQVNNLVKNPRVRGKVDDLQQAAKDVAGDKLPGSPTGSRKASASSTPAGTAS